MDAACQAVLMATSHAQAGPALKKKQLWNVVGTWRFLGVELEVGGPLVGGTCERCVTPCETCISTTVAWAEFMGRGRCMKQTTHAMKYIDTGEIQ